MYDAVGLVSSEPKNASRRTVDLLQKAAEALRSHRKRQMDQPTVGAQWTDNGLVFTITTIGTPLEVQKIVNRHFKPLLRRTSLPNILWHDLRHPVTRSRCAPEDGPIPHGARLNTADPR
jgi:integrase